MGRKRGLRLWARIRRAEADFWVRVMQAIIYFTAVGGALWLAERVDSLEAASAFAAVGVLLVVGFERLGDALIVLWCGQCADSSERSEEGDD